MMTHADQQTAQDMCGWLDSHDFTSPPCTVSVSSSSVDVKIETSANEAAEICAVLSSTVRSEGVVFASGWKLRILDPRANNRKVGECKL